MPEFLTPLDMEQISEAHESPGGRPLYRLTHRFQYRSDILGTVVTVPKGFQTDLASVPRIPFAWLLTGGHGNRAGVVHDYLCGRVDRKLADRVFREALETSGVPAWRTWMMYAGVRIGAAFS